MNEQLTRCAPSVAAASTARTACWFEHSEKNEQYNKQLDRVANTNDFKPAQHAIYMS
ncbi:Hypothetical protein POVR2_LOCUS342 [uncultured virus]|nr:Hypothetical protein POVR2_LOCUS342 [uncultured virus]